MRKRCGYRCRRLGTVPENSGRSDVAAETIDRFDSDRTEPSDIRDVYCEINANRYRPPAITKLRPRCRWDSRMRNIKEKYHGLRSGAAVGGSVGRVAHGWSHGAGMAVSWMRERLELHGLARVHLLAESQKVEGRVRADLVLHTCKWAIKQGRLCR